MDRGTLLRILLFLIVLQIPASTSQAQRGVTTESVLVATPKPYDRVISAIESRGGVVRHQFKYVDGVAADIPEDAMNDLRLLLAVEISKDEDIPFPEAMGPTRPRNNGAALVGALATEGANPVSRLASKEIPVYAAQHPEIYGLNAAGTQIEKLHEMGFFGTGITVAVVDSGLRSGYKLLSDSIAGGVDFVDDGAPGPAGDSVVDWKKAGNDGHGTFAGGLIAGNAVFGVNSILQESLDRYFPGAVVDGKLALIGTAPDAKLYMVRVFGDNAAAGARVSTVLASIEHIIDLRETYDGTGGRQGIKIDVANLSLGVATLAAGRTLLDQSVDAMLAAGIIPVVSEGNTGPSGLTTSSPGSSFSAITVGGLSRAANERLGNELFYGVSDKKTYYPGIGADIRPFLGTEIAWFSSRGPNADGRADPDVVASAVGNISQGYCPNESLDACFKRISIGSGTSFSAPIVSGIAAVLRQAFPTATATQIRNAIIETARINQIENYFTVMERGHGLPDAYEAYQLLDTGTVSNSLPAAIPPFDLVRDNMEQIAGLPVLSGSADKTFSGMKPGERGEILFEIGPDVKRVVVRVNEVEMTGPQNAFYGGDSLFVYVHSARTSSFGAFGNYPVNGVLMTDGEDRTFTVEDPETGILRITLNPDTLNAGLVSAHVTISIEGPGWPSELFSGNIGNGAFATHILPVPPGTSRLDFLLAWDHDWSRYPTSDIDLIVCAPAIPQTIPDCRALGNKQAATLASPERVSIVAPPAGDWYLVVHGFNIPSSTDHYSLRAKIVP